MAWNESQIKKKNPAEKKLSETRYEKKIILNCNITTTYIKHKYKNTRTSVLILQRHVEKEYH